MNATRTPAPLRGEFPVFRPMPTRWLDNDHYGHVNNVIYYSYFDTAVNGYLIDATAADIRDLPAIGLVVETGCQYFAPVSFPDRLEVGLALARLGTSSVEYRLAVFVKGQDAAAALGRFVHVYVDQVSRRPVPVPDTIRRAIEPLAV
ncbi:MAG: thioesterase family protein [Steroidobacteraceae bacterium]|nr:thioesterase family protein [Steroidobacteraceae bacterium]